MEEKKVGFWEGFINSFNPGWYEKIAKQRFSRSFFYLFILILIISTFLSVKFSSVITKAAGEFVDKAGQEIPEIRISNGVVSVPVKQPYIYGFPAAAFIIDTTGEINSLDDYESGMLLTKDKIIYKDKNRIKTESYDLSQIASLHITPEGLKSGLKKFSKLGLVILFIIMVVYFLIAKFIQIFLFSLASVFTSNLKKKNLSYAELLNIGVYALTPPTILAGIVILFNLRFPLFNLIYFLLYILILVLAIGKLPRETCTSEVTPAR